MERCAGNTGSIKRHDHAGTGVKQVGGRARVASGVLTPPGVADSHCRCNTSLLKSGSSQMAGYVTAVDIASSSAVRPRWAVARRSALNTVAGVAYSRFFRGRVLSSRVTDRT